MRGNELLDKMDLIDPAYIEAADTAPNKRKRVCVISNEYDRIRRFIIDQLGRGCSLYEVIGGYTGEKSIEIQSHLTQEEFSNLMEFLKREGIKSFVTAGNVSEVYGLWLKHKKFHF